MSISVLMRPGWALVALAILLMTVVSAHSYATSEALQMLSIAIVFAMAAVAFVILFRRL